MKTNGRVSLDFHDNAPFLEQARTGQMPAARIGTRSEGKALKVSGRVCAITTPESLSRNGEVVSRARTSRSSVICKTIITPIICLILMTQYESAAP